ncbi:hypothetical protein ACFYS8_00810 [Kitasatospora sp. NPDC004615]|uniref:hypothetical protein n=1 Tax=Kitasatospora sp. NPDC004615 TaxID=3364017 RepID=UPI0036B02850
MSSLLAADADAPNWSEVLSSVSGAAAAVLTLGALIATIWLAQSAQRKSDLLRVAAEQRAVQDRAEADQRLRDERDAADRRLREERADRDRRQARDWQATAALDLLRRISDLIPHLEGLGRSSGVWWDYQAFDADTFEGAFWRLQQGAHTTALALGDANATALYRNLVNLVVTAQEHIEEQTPVLSTTGPSVGEVTDVQDLEDRVNFAGEVALDVRRYSRYVRLWLCTLIETGAVPDQAVGPAADRPDLPSLAWGSVAWTPVLLPNGWWEDTYTDPKDPAFANRRL